MVDLKSLTANIIAAYVEQSRIPADDLPPLIHSIYDALQAAGQPCAPATEPFEKKSAAEIRKSIANPGHIVSFIDGKPYRTLKRHLTTQGMTPEQYRVKYGLPVDYPLVSKESFGASLAVGQSTWTRPGKGEGGP